VESREIPLDPEIGKSFPAAGADPDVTADPEDPGLCLRQMASRVSTTTLCRAAVTTRPPGLMIPPFSRAMSVSLRPRYALCSREILR